MNETEGFFPERGLLRARRLRALAPQPAEPAEARTRRETSVVLWVAVFLPMFVSPILIGATSRWHGRLPPELIEAIRISLWLLLGACALCAAMAIWRNVRSRAS